jgi:hypothetical protein
MFGKCALSSCAKVPFFKTLGIQPVLPAIRDWGDNIFVKRERVKM